MPFIAIKILLKVIKLQTEITLHCVLASTKELPWAPVGFKLKFFYIQGSRPSSKREAADVAVQLFSEN